MILFNNKMVAYHKLCVIYLFACAINIVIAEYRYDTLDPWGDPPKETMDVFDDVSNKQVCLKGTTEDDFSYKQVLMYYQRLIKIVFKRGAFKENRDSSEKEYIRHIQLSVKEEQLNNILNTINTLDDLRKIDGIITDIFSNSHNELSEKFHELIDDWSYSLWTFMEKPHAKIILFASIFIMLVIYFKFVSRASTFWITFVLLLLTSFCWTYYEIYVEEEIKRAMHFKNNPSIPKECKTQQDMSYYEIMQYQFRRMFFSDTCKEYYLLTSKTSFETINPALVAMETITRLVTQPISTASQKLGEGLFKLYDSIPFPFNLILFPIALVFFFLLIIIFASRGLGIDINFKVLYNLISLSISPTESKQSSPVVLKKNKEVQDAIKMIKDNMEQEHERESNAIDDDDLKRILDLAETIVKKKQRGMAKARMIECKKPEKGGKKKKEIGDGDKKDEGDGNRENVNTSNVVVTPKNENCSKGLEKQASLHNILGNIAKNEKLQRLLDGKSIDDELLDDVNKNGGD